jgi:hypothetical protein
MRGVLYLMLGFCIGGSIVVLSACAMEQQIDPYDSPIYEQREKKWT